MDDTNLDFVELNDDDLALITGGAGERQPRKKRCRRVYRPRMCHKPGGPSYQCGSSVRTVCN